MPAVHVLHFAAILPHLQNCFFTLSGRFFQKFVPVLAGHSMRFDEVGPPARLSGRPSAATNIPVVHTLLMAVQPTFDLEQKKVYSYIIV